MYNDYNRYGNYSNRPAKQKGGSGAGIFAVVLCVVILAAGALLYIRLSDRFDEMGATIDLHVQMIENYREALDGLAAEVTEIYEVFGLTGVLADGLTADVDDLRASIEQVSNLPIFADTNNSRSINIVDTAEQVGASIIGVRVHVPAQNTGGFWRQSRAMSSEGSGIIITGDGYIITNHHVIDLVEQHATAVLSVILSDGAEYIAELVGSDELNDLAVLKIDAEGLPYAALGRSDEMRVGDFVIAIGNPLGMYLSGSVTFGIVSGLNRTISAENVAENLIQTDAAINPGNSGGALLNLHGEVIGINTIKVSRSGGGVNVEGIGFAIPIDHARPLIDSIIQYGYVKGRPTIGFSGGSISGSLASIYRVPRGVLVEHLYPGGGAETVGIQLNDIITQVNGTNVSSMSEIAHIIRGGEVGDTVTVTLWRGGSFFEARVVLTEQR